MKNKITESEGGIVLNVKQQVLVVNQNHDSWSLPKGHVDPGETSFEAAKREIYEESGISKLEYIKEFKNSHRVRAPSLHQMVACMRRWRELFFRVMQQEQTDRRQL